MGVSRIKGITVEIGGDTTKLQTALKGVNTEIKNTQSQLKDVEKLLKLDPGNTELLAQKHRLLGDAVSETKEKLETLKTAAEQANTALANGDISQEQYDALQREIVETTEELKKLEEQAAQSETAVQKIAATGEKLKDVGDKVSGVGEKFLPVTAGVTALGTAAVKTAADFDTGMSKVAAISGATGDDLDSLREKAREMGAKTKFSASEAASAMEYMAMAGWKTEDMLGGIEGIMNLAAASGEDLATTSDIVTDALTAFGLSAQDSSHFADVLAAASSNANTNVSMLGESFKYAAPVAGSMGYSAEDASIALGLMANAGIKASQAGTALRTGLTNLAKPSKTMATYMDRYGVSLTDSSGKMYTMRELMGQLREKLGGLSEAEQAEAASAIFGKNAMAGWLAVINASDSDFEKLTNAIDNCDGVSQSMAETMQDNLEGQLTILKSQLEELAISFGEMIMPILRSAVTFIQGVVDKLNGMDEGTRKLILTIAAVAAAIGPVLIVVGKIISAVGTVMTIVPKIAGAINAVKGAFAALNGVMLANPIGIIIAAIAALVAAFIYLWNTNEDFRQFWIDLWENVKEVAITVWNAIKDFFTQAWEAIKTTCETVFSGIRDFFAGIWEAIRMTASTVWTAIKETIGGILQGIWNTITSVWQSIYDTISPLLEAFRYLFETIFEAVRILIGRALDAISAKVTEIWNGIVAFLRPLLEGLRSFFQTVWNAISGVVSQVLNAIKGVVQTVWNAIKGVIESVLNAIKSVVSTALNAVKNTFSTIWNNVKTTVTTVLNNIKNSVSQIFNNIVSSIRQSMTNVLSAVQQGFNNVVNYIRNLISQAFSWGKDLIMGIVNGIKSVISKVTDAVTSVADKIREVLHFSVPDTGPLTDYESWMPDFIGGLARGIEKSRGMIKDAMNDVAGDMVLSPNAQISGTVESSGSGMTEMLSSIRDTLGGLTANAAAGDITIPVYIGGNLIDEMVVTAQQRIALRSGGR